MERSLILKVKDNAYEAVQQDHIREVIRGNKNGLDPEDRAVVNGIATEVQKEFPNVTAQFLESAVLAVLESRHDTWQSYRDSVVAADLYSLAARADFCDPPLPGRVIAYFTKGSSRNIVPKARKYVFGYCEIVRIRGTVCGHRHEFHLFEQEELIQSIIQSIIKEFRRAFESIKSTLEEKYPTPILGDRVAEFLQFACHTGQDIDAAWKVYESNLRHVEQIMENTGCELTWDTYEAKVKESKGPDYVELDWESYDRKELVEQWNALNPAVGAMYDA
ncbi:hypothetical protein BDW59DRAFT_155069 [Aspergillus cavernicola]|uniref:Uncharacterized protein n=1 Tax=Aspergillus cavernicola TaxID=176166 RepID=A0ABR4HBQ7_9EURO